MKFVALLKENRNRISQAWLEKTLQTYPKDSFAFLKGQTDPFANPVGSTHKVAIDKLVELLICLDERTDFQPTLTDIIKIRSVQDFNHPQAVSFVFILKDTVRDVLKKELSDRKNAHAELANLDAAVDRMILQAFDVYCELREKLYSIRIEEVKRNVASLIRQTGYFDKDLDV